MNQTFDQLLETIEAEIECYRDMLPVLSRERDAAMHSDKDRLMRVGQAKQAVVEAITQTENRRQALVAQLAGQHGIQDRPLTVSQLCGSLEAASASRLKASADELKTLVATVQRENSANAKLISQALELVHGSLKLLNALIDSHAVYQKPGTDPGRHGYAGTHSRVFCGRV